MIAEAAKRLMAGVEGSEVVDYLRTELLASAQKGGREYSVNTLKTYVSHTRRKVLEADYRNVQSWTIHFFSVILIGHDSAFSSAKIKVIGVPKI